MADPTFALATFAAPGSPPRAALVLGGRALDLAAAHPLYLRSARACPGALSATDDVLALLQDWDRNFGVLRALADFVVAEGLLETAAGFAPEERRTLAPVLRPSKILNCAANYSGHLAEMRDYTQSVGKIDPSKMYQGDKSTAAPYLFLKAPSSLVGAYDAIEMPNPDTQLDWEAELGVVIGAAARRVSPERAIDHIAGFMTFNDVTARDELWRLDRPNLRSDWFSSKSHDTFAPAGPWFVPRAFVPNHGALRITLKVNGETKQDGLAGDMIFSPEEQIAYASSKMTLEPGDLFATGTLAGVGQATGVFLKPGDVVETTVAGLGTQRNRVVAAGEAR